MSEPSPIPISVRVFFLPLVFLFHVSNQGPEMKRARVLYDFDAADSTEMNLQADEVIYYQRHSIKTIQQVRSNKDASK